MNSSRAAKLKRLENENAGTSRNVWPLTDKNPD